MSYYGTDPLSRYERTFGPQSERPSKNSISGYDAFGNPLRGSYLSSETTLRMAQDKLFAQALGGTSKQILGPGDKSGSYLRPEQMEALLRVRERFGGSQGNAATAANLSAPGGGLAQGPPDASGMSVRAGFDPKKIGIIAGAALLLIFLVKRR